MGANLRQICRFDNGELLLKLSDFYYTVDRFYSFESKPRLSRMVSSQERGLSTAGCRRASVQCLESTFYYPGSFIPRDIIASVAPVTPETISRFHTLTPLAARSSQTQLCVIYVESSLQDGSYLSECFLVFRVHESYGLCKAFLTAIDPLPRMLPSRQSP